MKERMVVLGIIALLAILASQTALVAALSTGSSCGQDVPVFTTDLAPSNGTLVFKTQLGGKDRREDTPAIKTWNVSAGQRIDDVVSRVPAPRWARLWWRPDGDSTWYLLPSQYWHGDGTTASLYGVSRKPAAQPSYHTSFSSAIPEDGLPLHRSCPAIPRLVSPANEAILNTLVPLFKWAYDRAPEATAFQIEIARDPGFAGVFWTYEDESLVTDREWLLSDNLEVSTTYYWRAFYVCDEIRGPYGEWSFTTGSDGIILPAPNLIAPSNTSIVPLGAITLQWEKVDRAVEYVIEWGESDQQRRYIRWTKDTQCKISYDLRPDTTYEWSVAARSDYAIGASATWRFTTSPPSTPMSIPTPIPMPTPTSMPTPTPTPRPPNTPTPTPPGPTALHSPHGSVAFGRSAYSPDSSMYAREVEPQGYGNIGILDLATGELLRIVDATQHPSDNSNDLKGLAWSPDSDRLAVMYHYNIGHAEFSSISIMDVDTGKEITIITTLGFYHHMRFHPLLNVIIVTGHQIDIDSGTVTSIHTDDYPPVLPPTIPASIRSFE